MQLDTEYLRRHYASLSDEELHSMDRADLVEAARQIFDEEVRQRKLSSPPKSVSRTQYRAEEDVELDEASADGSAPGWLEDAGEAFSSYARPGTTQAPEAVHARDEIGRAHV